MAKKVATKLKLNLPAGKATPSQTVGPALGQAGINMMEFLKKFNEATSKQMGNVLPCDITVYEDRSYDFVVKQPLVAELIKKTANIQKGASNPLTDTAGTLTNDQLKQIAETKMPDLNANDIEAAMKIVAGTARSMGVKIQD